MNFDTFNNINIKGAERGSGKTTWLIDQVIQSAYKDPESVSLFIANNHQMLNIIKDCFLARGYVYRRGSIQLDSGKCIILTTPETLKRTRGVRDEIDIVYVDEIGLMKPRDWEYLTNFVDESTNSSPDLIGTQTSKKSEEEQFRRMTHAYEYTGN